MSLSVQFCGFSDIGKIRDQNQDAWRAVPEIGLFVVADGMGGHAGGDIASRIVAEQLVKMFRERPLSIEHLQTSTATELVRDSFLRLNSEMLMEAEKETGLKGMGATVVLCVVRESLALVGHLGDCRAYLYRDNHLRRLTKDHSVVQMLLEDGHISDSDIPDHPARGQVVQCIGMKGLPDPDISVFPTEAGDSILLCSDGLTGMVSDTEIESILGAGEKDFEMSCRLLVEKANEHGGEDNTTAVLLSLT